MSPTRLQTQAVARFTCLGAECPDTCCQGWGMQLTRETFDKYAREAPELLEAVAADDAGLMMRRDPATDACVKFDQGLCSIHRDYGDMFLGDACHFFPRVTRALGATVVTGAALSCPETARVMLYTPDAFRFGPREEIRVPYSLKNYLPEGVSEGQALAIHAAFLAMAGEEAFSAEHNLMRISAVARALDMQPVTAWGDALPLYIGMAEGRVPPAEEHGADMFNLLHALHGLAKATPQPRARLTQLIQRMADALGVSFVDDGTMQLAPDAMARAVQVLARSREYSVALQPVFTRYVQAQLSEALFPFAGLGGTLGVRITIIGVRFATMKLALAAFAATPSTEDVIRTIQVLSRFMDHLSDAALSLAIYQETGWVREPRLRAIVGE